MSELSADVTTLLQRVAAGSRRDREDLFHAVEIELRRIARGYLRRERPGHSLPETALVHDAFLKATDAPGPDGWRSRKQFFTTASLAMRNALVDHARRKTAARRGGRNEWVRVPGVEATQAPDRFERILELSDALDLLIKTAPRQADVVLLYHFGGRTHAEVAEILEISERTVLYEWAAAKKWLHARLAP